MTVSVDDVFVGQDAVGDDEVRSKAIEITHNRERPQIRWMFYGAAADAHMYINFARGGSRSENAARLQRR
jgi:hypothetical protein